MRKYVFMHVPKTGGTSLQHALRRIVGQDAVSPSFNASNLSEADAARLDRYRVISGHISIADVRRYFPERAILTILRDPAERCVSWYYFARRVPLSQGASSDVLAAHETDIHGFFGKDKSVIYRNIFNRQVRQLGDHALNVAADHERALDAARGVLREAAWVGLQETLAADFARLAILLEGTSASFELERLNHTARTTGALDATLRAAIARFNEFDCALYDFARGERAAGRA
jgi:hypothetical protein